MNSFYSSFFQIVVRAWIPCFLLILLAVSQRAYAISECTEIAHPAVNSFTMDSLQVKLDGESEFHDADSGNFCYWLQELELEKNVTRLYIVNLLSPRSYLPQDFPPGTEFKVSLTNLVPDAKMGGVFAFADEARAVYGDQNGGSPHQVTIAVRSRDIYQDYQSCGMAGGTYGAILYVFASSDPLNYGLQRIVLTKGLPGGVGIPYLIYDSENVQLSLDQDFYGCSKPDKDYDAFIDVFFPTSTLARAGLSKDLLSFLDDEMLPYLFTSIASTGMQISAVDARKSYGERQNPDGVPSSSDFTGLIIRIEALNDGWTSTANSNLGKSLKTMKSGGFRIKPSARSALKACTLKKKMKKGYVFKRKGKTLSCKKKAGKKK